MSLEDALENIAKEEPIPCDRCGREEKIPTYQGLVINDHAQYLCNNCNIRFFEWLNRGRKGGANRGSNCSCGRCMIDEYISDHHQVHHLNLNSHYLCGDCVDGFTNWYNGGNRRRTAYGSLFR
jgi:transposase-like protein